jgi:hypothetical protein
MSEFDIISILAGGWSVEQIDTSRLPGFVIAVNDSAIHGLKVDLAITMDRLWAEHRFYWLQKNHAPKPFWVRRSATKNLPTKNGWMTIFENDHTSCQFSETSEVLNGTNSGFCALNLAYQMKPQRVVLFGFDMNRSPAGHPYWFPEYHWTKPGGATTGGKYQAWAQQFEAAAAAFRKANIDVLNASPTSAITTFPKVNPEKVLV